MALDRVSLYGLPLVAGRPSHDQLAGFAGRPDSRRQECWFVDEDVDLVAEERSLGPASSPAMYRRTPRTPTRGPPCGRLSFGSGAGGRADYGNRRRAFISWCRVQLSPSSFESTARQENESGVMS